MHTARRFQLKKQKNQSQQRATVPRSRIMRGKQKDQRSQAGTPELASKPIQVCDRILLKCSTILM